MIKYWFTSLQLSGTAGSGRQFGVGTMLDLLFGNSAAPSESRSSQHCYLQAEADLPANSLCASSLHAGDSPMFILLDNHLSGSPRPTGTTGLALSLFMETLISKTKGLEIVTAAFKRGIDGIQFLAGDRDGRRLWRSGQIRHRSLNLT